MSAEPSRRRRLHAILLSPLLIAATLTPAAGMGVRTEEALLQIEAVLEMSEFSENLWPSWDISGTPFALQDADSSYYLINHPRPPARFQRVREHSALRTAVYRAMPGDIPPGEVCVLEGVSTAVLDLSTLQREVVPLAFEASFRAHGAEVCAGRLEPIDLIAGYPMDAWNVVLADIECRLLHRLALAPDDSLGVCVREFASVRRHRRLRMGGRYGEFERRIEFSEGIPAYLAERCRREAESHLRGRFGERLNDALGEPGALERCFPESPGLDWYRGERFRWTGAVLCAVMDRFDPDWKTQVMRECADPFAILLEEVRGDLPPAREVLDRFGYDELVARMTTTIEESKSDAERLFEGIVRGDHPTMSISTHLLASGEVSFDPSRIQKVDAHREVHTGALKIEYSGGTHFYSMGVPAAVVLGDDEFDFRTVVVAVPEEYSVVMDGVPFEVVNGVHEFTSSLSVTAEGLSLEAASGTVMVGESGISFILFR